MEEKRKINRIFSLKKVICLLLLVIVYVSLFIKLEFNDMGFEQLLFAVANPKGANYEIVWKALAIIIVWLLLTFLFIWTIKKMYLFLKIGITIKIGFKNKTFEYKLFKMTKIKKNVFFVIYILFAIVLSVKLLALDKYIIAQVVNSSLIEDYYVSYEDIEVEFPEKKRNLIYIYVESLEASNVSKNNGGLVSSSYTPNLERLALENINFSQNTKVGGIRQVYGSTYTMAALVSQTSGVPLKVPIDWNYYDGYSDSLPGVYSLGDILEENGYNNYFMLGSDSSYGGRKSYFQQHGNYEILDYYWAIDEGYIEEDYFEWWGYEDAKLFEYAKKKLLEISKEDEPFNFTILTADTHFTDGYMDDDCKDVFDDVYANSFYCSDSKIGEFVKWIKKQDFYKNTTIVIVGDHLTMQSDFYDVDTEIERYIYNVFINSKVKSDYVKNREFSSFDMLPTTLASLGVEIEGEYLALGVNLFSGEATLIEKLGYDYLNEELAKKSFFYDEKILGDSYYEMVKNKKEISE